MVTQANIDEVSRLKEDFTKATSAVFANFSGVNAVDMTLLRKELRDSDTRLKVVKNTLAKIAAEGTDFQAATDFFEGPVSVALGFGEDISAPAKTLLEFAKKNKDLDIIGGLVDGSLMDKAGVKSLADMPPKPVVQSMLLNVLQAPARNFVGVLEGSARKFMYVLSAIAEKRKEENRG